MDPGSLAGFLVGALFPSPSWGEIRAAARPSRYSLALPAQVAHAQATGLPGGLAANLGGDELTGGEDWANEEVSAFPPAASAGLQHVTNGLARSAPMPLSWYRPNLPAGLVEGRGTGYVTDAYNKGWIDLRAAGGASWGASAGYGAAKPNVQPGTLLWPTETTPAPKAMAATYQATNAGRLRLSDMFGD